MACMPCICIWIYEYIVPVMMIIPAVKMELYFKSTLYYYFILDHISQGFGGMIYLGIYHFFILKMLGNHWELNSQAGYSSFQTPLLTKSTDLDKEWQSIRTSMSSPDSVCTSACQCSANGGLFNLAGQEMNWWGMIWKESNSLQSSLHPVCTGWPLHFSVVFLKFQEQGDLFVTQVRCPDATHL